MLIINTYFILTNIITIIGDSSNEANILDEAKKYIGKKYNKKGEVYLGLVHRLGIHSIYVNNCIFKVYFNFLYI